MEEVGNIEDTQIPSRYSIFRSKVELPKLLDTDSGKPAIRAFNLDMSKSLDLVSPEEIVGDSTREFQFPNPSLSISNDHLISNLKIMGVKVIGLFENPEEVDTFNVTKEYDDCGNLINEKCDTPMLSKDFHLAGYLAEAVELKTAFDIARFYGLTLQDTNSNAKDESEGQQRRFSKDDSDS